MSILDIILIAIGLAMDCFAVSVGQGLSSNNATQVKDIQLPKALLMAIMFGIFQGGMPLIGYYAGTLFTEFFSRFSPWIALVLLAAIGGKMIWEALHENIILCKLDSQKCSKRDHHCEHPEYNHRNCPYHVHHTEEHTADFSLGHLVLLAIATSIDALATGVIFIPVPQSLWIGVGIIALVSLLFSIIGYLIGVFVGTRFKLNVGLIGGVILIVIGLKIFVQGLFF